MIEQALRLPNGGFVVPGNRWDLVPAEAPRTISVIIPYFQGLQQLALVLEGLKLQQFPGSRFEVIVADDGSVPPLRRDDLDAGDLRLRVVTQEDRGFRAGAARNLAYRAADGDVLCFIDQDTIPEPGYLRAISRLPSSVPDALVVGRREHADLTGWTPQRVHDWLSGYGPAPTRLTAPEWLHHGYRNSQDLLHADQDSYRYLISAVMACSRELFEELGGFDESFRHYGGEDWDLAYRAWNAGAVLAHQPDAVAWHDGPDWAGRSTAEHREAMKVEERQALQQRIPQEDERFSDHPGRPANVVLHLGGAADAGRPEVDRALTSQLNVTADPQGEARDRARYHAYLESIPADTDLVALIEDAVEELRRSGAGQVWVPEAGLRVVTSRAERRTERWQGHFPQLDLMAELFGTAVVPSRASSA